VDSKDKCGQLNLAHETKHTFTVICFCSSTQVAADSKKITRVIYYPGTRQVLGYPWQPYLLSKRAIFGAKCSRISEKMHYLCMAMVSYVIYNN